MKIREVGKFKILEVIGQGSFGKVYKGLDRTNSTQVALKFIPRKGKTKRQLDNLRQQIQILKKLHHPNIISLIDHIETQNQFIVITEFAGSDLSTILEKETKFKTEKVKQYGLQILSALLYLSDHRIVHRDLKPQNILIKQGIIKICDFGFARKMSNMTIQLHSLKGTPLYIAPEIVSQKPYNHKVDIWSLGIILFQLNVGRPPFYAESYHKLIPKILHDRVRYPKDMDVELRDLVDGMLQKMPGARYDWAEIVGHPFMKGKGPLGEVESNFSNLNNLNNLNTLNNNNVPPVLPKQKPPAPDEFQEYFPLDPRAFRSSILQLNKDRIEIATLRKYQQQIKQGKQTGKELKTNILFYHQLISLFTGYSLGEPVSKEYLVLTMRILSRLISQVKLQGDLRDDDITKKPDLLGSIVGIVPAVEDMEVLQQTYLIVGYLLKSNFDSVSFDLDFAERFVGVSRGVLEKGGVDGGVYTNLVKVLGILAGQSLITLGNSQEFFEIAANSEILYSLTANFIPEKQSSLLLFECLTKFIHPLRGEPPTPTPPFIQALTQLKIQVGEGFQNSQKVFPFFLQIAETYSPPELLHFNAIFYECVKFSDKFRGIFSTSKYISIFQKIPHYTIPMAYYMLKFEGKQVINTNSLKMQIAQDGEIEHPLHRAFEINFLILSMNSKGDVGAKLVEQIRFYLHKIGEVLRLEEGRKERAMEGLEGWAFGCLPYKFDDILVSGVMELYGMDQGLEEEFVKVGEEMGVWENMVRVGKEGGVNLSGKYFAKVLPFFIRHCQGGKPSKKLIPVLAEALLHYLSPEEIAKLKSLSSPPDKHPLPPFILNCCTLIDSLHSKCPLKLSSFFSSAENISLHRLLLDEDLLLPALLPHTLRLLYKILQKSSPAVLDFVAVNGLSKLGGKYCREAGTETDDVLLELVQIISHLARSKAEYYPNIASLPLLPLLPSYLSSKNEQLIYRTLNLIGNLAKHSTYFFAEFHKHGILPAVVSTLLHHSTKHFQKNIIYAIGNISFYNEQFKSDIKLVIPYLSRVLDGDDEHLLANTISTLSNLLRHSGYFVGEMMREGVVEKVVAVLGRGGGTGGGNGNLVGFALGFLVKAVGYKEVVGAEGMREKVRKGVKRVVCAVESEVGRKVGKVLEKLG